MPYTPETVNIPWGGLVKGGITAPSPDDLFHEILEKDHPKLDASVLDASTKLSKALHEQGVSRKGFNLAPSIDGRRISTDGPKRDPRIIQLSKD